VPKIADEKMHENYPGIARAAHLISLDNGCVNRHRSDAERLRDLDKFLAQQLLDLREIDDWLLGLSDEDLEEVCCGCADDAIHMQLLSGAPPFTDALLNDFFDSAA
jgi:hypothetical protein